MLSKIIFSMFILVMIVGCSDNKDTNELTPLEIWNANMQQYVLPNIINVNRKYDYFEIVNDNIVYTSLDMDLLNVNNYFNTNLPIYKNGLYEVDTQCSIVNKALDINKTVDAMVFYNYDTLTKLTEKSIFIKEFGLYMKSKNICIVNSFENNCSGYIFLRY